MGNSLQRANRCQGHHILERCFCLPWKKICTFKSRQDSQKENEGMTSAHIQQDNASQPYTEELCYVLINHSALRRRPSGNSAEEHYENVPCKAKTPRDALQGTETEYSLLRVPPTPRHPPSPQDEYALLMPSTVSFRSLPQSRPLMVPFETHFSHVQ